MWASEPHSQILFSKTKFLIQNGVENIHSQHLSRGSSKLNKFKNVRRFREINNVYVDKHTPNNNDLVIIEGCSESGKKSEDPN